MKYTIILGIGLNMFFPEVKTFWVPEIVLFNKKR